MKSDEKKDVVPYFSTLPMLQPEWKDMESRVTIPQEDDVRLTKRWSEELKL